MLKIIVNGGIRQLTFSFKIVLIKPVGGTVDGRLQVLLADVGVDLGNREPFSRYCGII